MRARRIGRSPLRGSRSEKDEGGKGTRDMRRPREGVGEGSPVGAADGGVTEEVERGVDREEAEGWRRRR